MTGSMTAADRETLCALLDGELAGDERRFALRRLSHDADWQRAAARWQLAGDALRGESVLPAPSGFAARVAAAVAAEAETAPVAMATAAARPRGRRPARWFGGAALAASVAMVAMFAVRPMLQPMDEAELAGTGVQREQAPDPAAAPAGERLAIAPAADAPPPQEPAAPVETSEGMSALAAAAPLAVAAAEAGRREQARSRGQQQRAALRASQDRAAREVPPQVAVAAAEPAEAPRDAVQLAGATPALALPREPFAAADEIQSRPWPEALPALSGRSAFTAGFQPDEQTAAPSFYPFEPRLPPELREQLGVAPPPAGEPALRN